MAKTRFDQASRFAARMDPVGFLVWLLSGFLTHLRWKRWLDTRTTPTPGETEQTGDTVAEVVPLDSTGPPFAIPVEFQTEPDPDIFGRLLIQLGRVWLEQRPDPLPGSRYQLAAAVVHLTGSRASAPASREYVLPGGDGTATILRVRERFLAEEPAEETLRRLESGELSRCVLPFVVVMLGGGEEGNIRKWLELAGQEPDPRRRGELGGLALVLAELKDWYPAWQEALRGWNVRESQVVRGWMDEALVAGLRETLRLMLKDRFGGVSEELGRRIDRLADAARLQQAVREVYRVEKIDDLPL